MKKAGIITLIDFYNYGNRLQNYAVCKTLEKMGIEAQTIFKVDDRKAKLKLILINCVKKLPFVLDLKLICSKKKDAVYRKYLKLDKFTQNNIKMKVVRSDKSIKEQCSDLDYFVIGSDQIWNPEYGFDNDYIYAGFAEDKQKVCFSPSFGVQSILEGREAIADQLTKIPYISVREESGKEIVKELTGKEAEVLIDPTMMLNAQEWEAVCEKNPNIDTKEKYILSYFLGKHTKEQEEKIEHIKKKYKLKEYVIMDRNNEHLYSAGIGEFLELIRNADLVCTDSFHACVFSIIFQVPFCVFDRDGNGAGMSSRIDTLLEKFDLSERYENQLKEDALFVTDYKKSIQILEEERKKVYSYLKRAMQL